VVVDAVMMLVVVGGCGGGSGGNGGEMNLVVLRILARTFNVVMST
jgi:hypothetical protein